MWAVAKRPDRKIAIMAQNPESLGKSLTTNPGVKTGAAPFERRSVPIAAPFHVIEAQELHTHLATAPALWLATAVVAENVQFESLAVFETSLFGAFRVILPPGPARRLTFFAVVKEVLMTVDFLARFALPGAERSTTLPADASAHPTRYRSFIIIRNHERR
jgi:hypothetical protein